MSDWLKRRFPLADTSTVYMSGEAVYNLVQYSKPGIIAPVTLSVERAELFREAVKEAMEEAYHKGYEEGYSVGREINSETYGKFDHPDHARKLP